MESPKEAVWCDHVRVEGVWIGERRAVRLKPSIEGIFLIVEENRAKLMCSKCFVIGLKNSIGIHDKGSV